jgi:hypothetical protein
MAFCDGYDLSAPNGQRVDRVLSLQFPGYGMRHPQHVVWLMHQHRAVYELFDPREATPALHRLRKTSSRTTGGRCRRSAFANSRRVAERLRQYNSLESTPLCIRRPAPSCCAGANPWNYVFVLQAET